MSVVSLLVLVALLLGNAFFVAAEFALVSTRADQIDSGPPRSLTKYTRLSADQFGARFVPCPSVTR